MKSDIAVVFDTKDYLIFKSLGADMFFFEKEQAKNSIKSILSSHKLVLITETLAKILEEELKIYEGKMEPTVLCLPSFKGESGLSYKNLSKKIRSSLGLDI